MAFPVRLFDFLFDHSASSAGKKADCTLGGGGSKGSIQPWPILALANLVDVLRCNTQHFGTSATCRFFIDCLRHTQAHLQDQQDAGAVPIACMAGKYPRVSKHCRTIGDLVQRRYFLDRKGPAGKRAAPPAGISRVFARHSSRTRREK